MNSDRTTELPPELKSLAADLASLVPAGGGLGRDALMYRAGWEACAASSERASSHTATGADAHAQTNAKSPDRRWSWFWPLSTAGLLLVSASLGIAIATRTPEVRVVYVEKSAGSSLEVKRPRSMKPAVNSRDLTSEGVAAARAVLPLPTSNYSRPPLRRGEDYLALRERVLAYGVEVLRPTDTSTTQGESDTATDFRYGALIGHLRGG